MTKNTYTLTEHQQELLIRGCKAMADLAWDKGDDEELEEYEELIEIFK